MATDQPAITTPAQHATEAQRLLASWAAPERRFELYVLAPVHALLGRSAGTGDHYELATELLRRMRRSRRCDPGSVAIATTHAQLAD